MCHVLRSSPVLYNFLAIRKFRAIDMSNRDEIYLGNFNSMVSLCLEFFVPNIETPYPLFPFFFFQGLFRLHLNSIGYIITSARVRTIFSSQHHGIGLSPQMSNKIFRQIDRALNHCMRRKKWNTPKGVYLDRFRYSGFRAPKGNKTQETVEND